MAPKKQNVATKVNKSGAPKMSRGPPIDKTAKPVKKKRTSTGYKVAAVLPAGEILTDALKCKWKLGNVFATGGFGRIYEAKPVCIF